MATEFRRMQQRRGTAAEWAANNIVLLAGEIALQTGPGAGEARAKIGDGVTPFGSLPWVFEVDQTARNGVASLTLSVTSLDTRVDALEAATGSGGALDDLTAAVAQNTADILARQMILPVGTNPGDLLFWSGTDYAATAFAPAMEHGSMFFWNATAGEYARVPNGAVGQALILRPGGVPGWGNPSSITVTLENTSIPLAGGASVEAAFNAAAPTIAANAITTVTWEGQAFHYVGAPGTAITTATAADFALIGYTTSGIADAPSDGKTYGRKDAAWSEVKPTNTAEPVSVPGTTMTLALADAGRYLAFTDPAGCAITFPTDAAVPIPIGTIIRFEQAGGGSAPLTFVGDTGVTIRKRSTKTAATAEDGAVVHAIKTGENEWTIWGDLA
jgi:hypothetical protein